MKTKKLVCYNCGGHGFITATYESGQTSAICPVCGGIGTHEIQVTNADRIRAMTDEELAELIDRETDSCAPTGDCEKMSRDCKACWLEWLKQPPREEDKHEDD